MGWKSDLMGNDIIKESISVKRWSYGVSWLLEINVVKDGWTCIAGIAT